MTTVVISQPMYFPWPGFFELVATADVYVHLDDVQFSKGGFTNRIQIKHASGVSWMTVPLAGKGTFQDIQDLAATGNAWKASHRGLLSQALRGSADAASALKVFDEVVSLATIPAILAASIEVPARHLGLRGPQIWYKSSELNVPGASSQRVLDIVKAVGGNRYVTAHGAANYLDHQSFDDAGVQVDYILYSKTPWSQRHGAFTPYVSVLDLIGNEGGKAGEFIRPMTCPWREFNLSRAG